MDLIVADHLKDSLSGPCLKYCLSVEGNKVLSSSELAALADTFDANYSTDGRYRGGTVLTYKEEGPRVTRSDPRSNCHTVVSFCVNKTVKKN